MRFPRILLGAAALVALTSLAACGAGANADGTYGAAATTTTPSMTTAMAAGGGDMEMMQFGAACDQVPASGAGSFDGMAKTPVATAASNNPLLSTLVSAVKKADLANSLNSAGGITVFAPDNAAFGKIAKNTLSQVLASNSELTKILTYHVVSGRITPAQLAEGKFTTLEGDTLTTSGTGEDYTINGSAHVVCGNVQTANATVYIIDSVLMPPM